MMLFFFGAWSSSNATRLVNILNLFQYASGLKVKMAKSRLYGIGVEQEEVVTIANLIHCSYDTLPFRYFGLPVGKLMNKSSGWYDVIECFTKHLSFWKSKILSIGCRLMLAKSVLGSLPLYYLSIFRAPIKVINTLESIRNRFFWGFSEGQKGITWVN